MSATRENNPSTASPSSGNEIFEQALKLSCEGIDLLLEDFFSQLVRAKFHRLSARDSKRLIVQIDRKWEVIHSSFLFRVKSNFADFKASRKSRLHESISTDRQPLGLVGTNEYAETEELESLNSRFEERYSKYYQSTGEQLARCINRSYTNPLENPLHVKCLSLSFRNAIEGLNLVIAQKIALYKLFADTVVDRLEPVYESLEQCFIEHNTSTGLKPMSNKPSAPKSSNPPTPGNSVAMAHIPVLMGVFQSYKDSSKYADGTSDNIFPDLKQTLGKREVYDFDHPIDQLSAIFELVFSDEDIPNLIRHQIARLQIFIFMSEIQQSGFPTHSSHPARRLIETIIRTEVDLDLEGLSDQSGYDFLRNEIDKIGSNPFIDPRIYTELCEQYVRVTAAKPALNPVSDEAEVETKDGVLPSQEPTELSVEVAAAPEPEPEQASALESEPEIIEEIELSGEDTVVSSKRAENIYTVIHSIVNDMTLPLRIQGRSLILFDEVWSPLLLEVATNQGFKSQAWQKMMTIAKTQVWVLTPKTSQTELDKLMSTLAYIEKSLTQSMQSLSIPAEQQTSLLEFLEHEQNDVITQSRTHIEENKKAELRKESPMVVKPENADHGAVKQKNDQLGDTIDEFSSLMQTGRFKKSNDMLKALDSDREVAKTKVQTGVDNIHKSDWVEIKKGEISVLAKLTWIAEDQSQYIFVDRDGQRICEISGEKLESDLKNGNISLISSTPINSQRAAYSVIQTI